jgi:hypothetical protein
MSQSFFHSNLFIYLFMSQAFEGWGSVLREQYGRRDDYVKSDFTANYLGYWTDNG